MATKTNVVLQSVMSKDEAAVIRAAAKRRGVSVSEYLRLIVVPVASNA